MSAIRSYARGIVLDILGAFSHPANGIHLLNGHRTYKEMEPDTFEHLLNELSKQVSFIRVEDAVNMIIRHIQPDHPLVAFTFDDGFEDCYQYFAPVLERHSVNALFFVNPNYVDGDEDYIQHFNEQVVMTPNKRPMRWSQLEELTQRGHIIGAHTMDHYMINTDDTVILHQQIALCKDSIESHLHTPCDYFAFPYGRLEHANRKAIDIACDTYKFVFSQSDYKHYFSFDGKVINRRHFEPFWPLRHVNYFLSCNKQY